MTWAMSGRAWTARERRARAPLLEAGFSKLETRLLARPLGLRIWDKPQAACLSSRIRHGVEVTEVRLARVEAAEAWLAARFGLRTLRVRDDGDVARIEVLSGDIARTFKLGWAPDDWDALSRGLGVSG